MAKKVIGRSMTGGPHSEGVARLSDAIQRADAVMIGAGAKVLGPVNVGDNVKVAAGAVVLKDIPENATAVGIPARVIREKEERREQNLDQVNIPDPIAHELNSLRKRISELERKIAKNEE